MAFHDILQKIQQDIFASPKNTYIHGSELRIKHADVPTRDRDLANTLRFYSTHNEYLERLHSQSEMKWATQEVICRLTGATVLTASRGTGKYLVPNASSLITKVGQKYHECMQSTKPIEIAV